MNWTEYFYNIAQQVKEKSKDNNTKIGALIVGKDKEIVSTGYNSFPRGIEDEKTKRQSKPEKYFWFEHAERNAIYNAARIGVSTKGCTMYLTCGIPCADCARGIINAGISKIFIMRDAGAQSKKWEESAARSNEMFSEAGVKIEWYNF
ncbi:MAG: deoxycytidylate deaminase [Cytophagales bacterium]